VLYSARRGSVAGLRSRGSFIINESS
jgi:hypothetical protein